MFEIWILQQLIICISITVGLGGILTVVLWYRMSKKYLLKDEPVLKQK